MKTIFYCISFEKKYLKIENQQFTWVNNKKSATVYIYEDMANLTIKKLMRETHVYGYNVELALLENE